MHFMLTLLLLIQLIILAVADLDYDCGLWLAPSYTGTAQERRFGLYAGRTYNQNETLPLAELAIPLIDMIESYSSDTPTRQHIIEFLKSYSWTSEYAGSAWEANYSAPVLIPGIGALPQFHSGMANVHLLPQSVLLRRIPKFPKAGTPHPSRGAITPYYNVTLQALKDIPAGMELFADFGELWDGNYTQDFYQDTISRHDYQVADQIIQELVNLFRDFPDLSMELKDGILDFMLDKVLGVAAGKHAKTIKLLIPDNPRKLQKVLDAGGSFMYRYPDMIRPMEWLASHGYCLDTIQMKESKIPYAGRGAFAKRKFHRGEIITLTPMLHIANKDLLNMYKIETLSDPVTGQKTKDYVKEGGMIGRQILLNYCFGHPESSLLLFPLASHVGLINHQSTPNAYITWSRVKDNGLSNEHQYQDYTVKQLIEVNKIVIVMKVVALREIEPDEEITIHYGEEWEAAWTTYMKEWESFAAGYPHPVQAEDLKAQYQHKPLEIRESMTVDPYSRDIATACFLNTRRLPDGVPNRDGPFEIRMWDDPENDDLYRANRLFIVQVLDRIETGDHFFYNYTVLAKVAVNKFQEVLNVPHAACTFVSRPYTSDIHIPGAFRHSIAVPDVDFPQAWRDLR